ncbi:YbjN domain-containing protein [Corynebacterium mendelii]|uniref:YbjN domain-containing protein n=1 Tax=Corynebacterium mendelii TaxID=2765362 RepID=A0A939DYF4_9CORY|nr:YbjN domain-containing protein [Corynebacterium mendelii]MBN9643151.1 YbjN domain-containing protein [Corynebacterium mendelii]
MSNMTVTQKRIEQWFATRLPGYTVDEDGACTFPFPSVRVFVTLSHDVLMVDGLWTGSLVTNDDRFYALEVTNRISCQRLVPSVNVNDDHGRITTAEYIPVASGMTDQQLWDFLNQAVVSTKAVGDYLDRTIPECAAATGEENNN